MAFEINSPTTAVTANRRKYSNEKSNLAFQPGDKPNDIETEKAVLSGIFISSDSLSEIQQIITIEDFYYPAHQLIYQALLKLSFDHTPIDLTTISSQLRDSGKLDQIGGSSYLSDILSTPSTSEHAIEYARIIADLSWRRKLLDASEKCKSLALKTGDTKQIAVEIEREIFNASQERVKSSMVNLGEILEDTISEFERRSDRDGSEPEGILTGLDDVDDCIQGFRPGQLIVLAAGPGQGKTSLATNIVCNTVLKQKRSVLFFSLEMTQRELSERILTSVANIDAAAIKKGNLSGQDYQNLYDVAEDLTGTHLYIDDRSIVTPFDVLAQSRRLISTLKLKGFEPKIDLIVCDYLQIMKPGGYFENRSLEVAAITGGLKMIAKELSTPVLALSQLNRDRSKRTGAEARKPGLSDLRDSGAIEADADIVMFIHREPSPESDSRAPTEAELIIGKNRSGPTKNIRLMWLGHLTKFVNFVDPSFSPADYHQNELPQNYPADNFGPPNNIPPPNLKGGGFNNGNNGNDNPF